MKRTACDNCGSSQFVEQVGYRYCAYCNTRFILQSSDFPNGDSPMTLNEDIANLLRKCRENPSCASRYANLILDINPTNVEAKKYL